MVIFKIKGNYLKKIPEKNKVLIDREKLMNWKKILVIPIFKDESEVIYMKMEIMNGDQKAFQKKKGKDYLLHH